MCLPLELRVAVVLHDVVGLSNEEPDWAFGWELYWTKAAVHQGRTLLALRFRGTTDWAH
jgi:hypothetical protein